MTSAMKKYVAVWGALFFFVICVSLYLMMETVNTAPGRFEDFDTESLNTFEQKINEIQKDILKNHDTIASIKDAVRKISNGDKDSLDKLKNILDMTEEKKAADRAVVNMEQKEKPVQQVAAPVAEQQVVVYQPGNLVTLRKEVVVDQGMCTWADAPRRDTDTRTEQLFETLSFDNPDGGAWKQGWPITYPHDRWTKKKLKVFVVPHSHNDPGWVKTFEDYYQQQTRHILNLAIQKLQQYKDMTFIYAEMSFFSMWWAEIDAATKNAAKQLLKEGRLEIVTGGWVMTDEANAHYFAMLDQLIEGHQWLNGTVGVKPRSGWAIDPFGHTPTMAYLLRRSGLKSMLIQRVHYAIKKHLAKNKQLEFMWRQIWDSEGTSDMLCHMMPFYSYDVPHTCGPDPKICCQFDFRRLPGSSYNCPWRIAPQVITDTNVAERAQTLLDQYRKKAELYRSDVLFIPLGDDFRYDKAEEWDQQFQNYIKLFNYMNSHPELGVEAKFGTLSDYFNALYQQYEVSAGQKPGDYPVHSGDFFTYSDRDDHYWSGYYTSRPFYKNLDRVMEHHLRAAEIVFSLAVTASRRAGNSGFPRSLFMEKLINARRNLGLYQHHDGITGTAKDFVVVDYGNRLLKGLSDMKVLIKEAATYLAAKNRAQYQYSDSTPAVFNVDDLRGNHDSLPVKTVLEVKEAPSSVMLYNPLGQARDQVVTVHINTPVVEVRDPKGQVIVSQVDPYWTSSDAVSALIYKLSFRAVVPAIGISMYTVRKSSSQTGASSVAASVLIFNAETQSVIKAAPFSIQKLPGSDFSLESPGLKAMFSGSTGMLKSVTSTDSGQQHKAETEFVKYGTVAAKDKSGAYLFLPDGPAQPVPYGSPVIRVVKGPVLSEVTVYLDTVRHTVQLHNSSGLDGLALDMHNIVDITKQRNYELAVRVKTDVNNVDHVFYTDLNGFQMQKHRTYKKLPLQANLYPMPTMAFIEDDKTRFSILSAQSLGMSNLNTGVVDVMLDRRLTQDDNRGLNQGVQDNKVTPSAFRLLFEKRVKGPLDVEKATAFPSLLGHQASLQLIHPIFVFPQNSGGPALPTLAVFSPLQSELPCDVHLLNLRTMQYKDDDASKRLDPLSTAGIYFHRLGIDCSFPNKGLMCNAANGQVKLADLFSEVQAVTAKSVSLTMMHEEGQVETTSALDLEPMEIASYIVQLQ